MQPLNSLWSASLCSSGGVIKEYARGDFFGERALFFAEPREFRKQILWTFLWTLEITAVSVGSATIAANGAVIALVLSSFAYRLMLSNTTAQDNLTTYITVGNCLDRSL